jgi:hypothetical protein
MFLKQFFQAKEPEKELALLKEMEESRVQRFGTIQVK